MQMIEPICRHVKDLRDFITCQTLIEPGGERSFAPDAVGTWPKHRHSLTAAVTKMKQAALVHDPGFLSSSEDALRWRPLSLYDLRNSDRWWSVPATPGTNLAIDHGHAYARNIPELHAFEQRLAGGVLRSIQ